MGEFNCARFWCQFFPFAFMFSTQIHLKHYVLVDSFICVFELFKKKNKKLELRYLTYSYLFWLSYSVQSHFSYQQEAEKEKSNNFIFSVFQFVFMYLNLT